MQNPSAGLIGQLLHQMYFTPTYEDGESETSHDYGWLEPYIAKAIPYYSQLKSEMKTLKDYLVSLLGEDLWENEDIILESLNSKPIAQ